MKNLTSIDNVTVVPCPHSAKEDGTCCYCGEAFEARNESTQKIYIGIYDALCDAAEGETVTMLADGEGVSYQFVYSESDAKRIILDLNGKKLGILRSDGEPLVTITDSKGGGVIQNLDTDIFTNEDLTVSDLLPSGYAFQSADGTWYDATHNAGAKKVANVSVKPQPTLTLAPESSSLTYGYNLAETTAISAAVSGADDVTVTYKWYVKDKDSSDSTFTLQDGATDSSFSFPEGKAAGDYDVKCVADCDGYVLEQTVTVTVAKADATYTAPKVIENLRYNGSSQDLITAGSATGGEMQYQLDGGAWDTQIPAADKAGTYRICYKVVGDANHNDTAEAELTVTIEKATPAPNAPLTANVTYGDAVNNTDIKGSMNAGDSTVDGSFVWENVSTYGDATDGTSKTLRATFIPKDETNYNRVEGLAVSVTVAKAAYNGTDTAAGSAKYGASNTIDLSGLLMSGGKAAIADGGITDTDRILGGTPTINGKTLTFTFNENATPDDTATVTVNVSDCKNYQNYTITVTLTVNDKNVPTVTAPAAKTLTYNGADQQLIEAAKTTGGILQYKLGTDSTWSEELPKAKNAGTFTVYYKVVGNDDYADVSEASIPVTIEKKNVTVKPKSYSITQGNEIPSFALEFDGLANGDSLNMVGAVQFTCTEADGTTPVSTQTAAGTYTITWTNPANFDFTDETNYAVMKETTGTLTISAKPSSSGSGGYSGGGASGGAPAPSEKPDQKPEKPENKPTLDRNERMNEMIRLPLQIMSTLHMPMLSRMMWLMLKNMKFFK